MNNALIHAAVALAMGIGMAMPQQRSHQRQSRNLRRPQNRNLSQIRMADGLIAQKQI